MVPLVVHSGYSFQWGSADVSEICRRARQLGYDRLALTDTDNLCGLWSFVAACEREGIEPIIGAEITDGQSRCQAVALVGNAVGYANLCRLITRRHMEDSFDLADSVPGNSEGLVLLVSDPDLLDRWHGAGVQVVAAMAGWPLALDHPLRCMARKLGCMEVAVPGSYFLRAEDVEMHRLVRAISTNTALCRIRPDDRAPDSAWLAGPQEYRQRFASCLGAVENTKILAQQLSFLKPEFGVVMPPYGGDDGRQAREMLRKVAYEGARDRYGGDLPEPVVDRLEYELGVIESMGFSSYFLVVRDIVRISPRTCGRGSGAASLVAYCLGITNVCPIKHNLYFERFLNPGRTDPPDIDVDFAWDERDHVLHHVLKTHKGHAAMVANHVLFQPRMAIREVAKVFGLTDGEIGSVTKRLPWYWRQQELDGGILSYLKELPKTRTMTFPPPWPDILRLAGQLIGLPRYLSVHPGGIIITPKPIDIYVPVQRAPKGVPIVQWEKDGVETAGLVKIDLLGNRSLGVIRDAIANVRANGVAFEEKRWEPEDDWPTQESISRGQTMGCFYIESPAMRLLQRKANIGDFEHLVIHSSIIRPAANEFIREYIRRLHGSGWEPIHPLLADVLQETYGILVYQEDVSRVAVALAGFTHEEADGLRKVLSKKDRERQLQYYRDRFFSGAKSRGVQIHQIRAVWDMILSFSGYSFCKPHSASYARVSFQAAYLKVHYPAEFMAAVISNGGGFYSTFAYVSEARRMGLTVLPPDVTISDISWTGKETYLRVGLMAIHGLHHTTRNRIIEERNDRPFDGIIDFFHRIRPDDGEAKALINSGALDSLSADGNRVAMRWRFMQWRQMRPWEPFNVFMTQDPCSYPNLADEDQRQRFRNEYAILGFLCKCHPMKLYADLLTRLGTVKAVALPEYVGKQVRFAGWLITGKTVRTQQGDAMEFLTFEDETGIVETTFFPNVYTTYCTMMVHGRPFLLQGKVERDWGAITLTVYTVESL